MISLTKKHTAAEPKSMGAGCKKREKSVPSLLNFIPDTNAIVSELSHDFRSPLNSMIGFSEILLSERIGKLIPEQKKQLGIILKRSSELLNTLDHLVEYCRVIQYESELRRNPIAIHPFLCSEIDNIQRSMHEKEIHILYTPAKISYRVLGDEQKLQLVLEQIFEGVLSLFKPSKIHINVKEIPEEKAFASRAHLRIGLIFSGAGIMDPEELFMWNVKSNIPGRVRFGMLLSRFYMAMMGGGMSVNRTKGRLEVNLILCKE